MLSQRMKSGERKVALLTITEHIEMELLSSEEPCVVILTQEEEKEHSFHQVSHQPPSETKPQVTL